MSQQYDQPHHPPHGQPPYRPQHHPQYASYASVPPYNPADSKRLPAGLCAILIGGLGVHKFILGYTTAGLIMLLVTLLTCGLGGIVMGVIGLIEGIIYLTKTDVQFYQSYVAQKKEWF